MSGKTKTASPIAEAESSASVSNDQREATCVSIMSCTCINHENHAFVSITVGGKRRNPVAFQILVGVTLSKDPK